MRTTFKLEIVAKSPLDNSTGKWKYNVKMDLKRNRVILCSQTEAISTYLISLHQWQYRGCKMAVLLVLYYAKFNSLNLCLALCA